MYVAGGIVNKYFTNLTAQKNGIIISSITVISTLEITLCLTPETSDMLKVEQCLHTALN